MNNRIPWFRVLAEGAVIVVSILLAFGIDALWDRLQEAELEEAVLQSLLDEFEANQGELEVIGDAHRLYYESGLVVLEVAYGLAEPDSLFSTRASYALATQVRLDVTTEALRHYLASENTGLLGGADLRRQLIEYRGRLDELWFQEDMVIELVRGQIARTVSARDDLLLIGTGSGSDELTTLQAAVHGTDRRDALLRLVREPEIRNLITARVGREYQTVFRHELLEAVYEGILRDLRLRLAPGAPR